jgi:hypothetical protein
MTRRTIKVRGRSVTFYQRVLRDGSTAYYRAGKRATTPSQIRAARGVLRGLTLREAYGHHPTEMRQAIRTYPFVMTMTSLPDQPHIQKWGRGLAGIIRRRRYDWYALINVVAQFDRPGSGLQFTLDDDEDPPTETAPATIQIGTHTLRDVTVNLEQLVRDALDRYGLILPPGDTIGTALIAVWRHRHGRA